MNYWPILLITVIFTFQSVSCTNPPVVGSFGDPLKWCPFVVPSVSPPTSVHKLRPSDIKVISAIGDSITAGFGLDGFWGSLTENRGKSWAMGGDGDVATIANFLKRYSPDIQGASKGSHWVEICADYFCPSAHIPAIDQLNAAQSGAWVQNLPAQVTWLIAQMKANPKIDFQKDWKVVTVLIGANNLCASCITALDPWDGAEQFEQSFQLTMKELAGIPRAFINVVQLFNISSVYTVSEPYPYCKDVHTLAPLECECDFASPGGAQNRAKMDLMANLFRAKITKVMNELPSRDDWIGILQPVLSQGKVPGIEYLSDLDCFHPSLFGARALAISVWNSMLLPKAQKPNFWNEHMLWPICPDNSTTLRTD